MKKILIVHNKYRFKGGEDIAVENEIKLLKLKYEIRLLSFQNDSKNLFFTMLSFLTNRNYKSGKIFKNVLNEFNPDLVYVHNTWFKASLFIFNILKKMDIPVILKLHNFRYNCSRYLLKKNHINKNEFCTACGMKNDGGIFNKYFQESFLKSIFLIRYGKLYFDVLRKNNLKIFVLTNFHKIFLENLDIPENKIKVFPNYIEALDKTNINNDKNFILYAGRISEEKGVEELIKQYLKLSEPIFSLKIAGEGPLLKSLMEKYKRENIEFLGEVSNEYIKTLILSSMAVVSPTRLLEGQPTLLCEASILGKAAIFPNSEGISEFFPKQTELSFKQYDYESLLSKLNMLKNKSLLDSESKNNKKFIEEKLNKENLLNNFEKIINE